MNEASLQRLALAQRVAVVYARQAGVRAIMLGGSTSRGWADRFSDVEIGVFWATEPTEASLDAPFIELQGAHRELDPWEEVGYEEYRVRDVKIDLRHMTTDRTETVLSAVLDGLDPSGDRQEIVSAIRDGVPLHGADLLNAWKARASVVSDLMAGDIVRRHLDEFPPPSEVLTLIERGDLPLVYAAFCDAVRSIIGILSGLNRRYDSDLKWLRQNLKRLALQPPETHARIQAIFRADPAEGVRIMETLVEETFDLIERFMPEIAVTGARQMFRSSRPVIDEISFTD